MNQMPLFSIITPTYNRANFISKAIESVLNQNFQDWEYIIIDDGSTDNTAEIIKSFNDDRIIYVYQKNQERSVARNNGVDLAKGQYICFLDSDDYYLSNHLEILHQAIIKSKDSVAFFYAQSKIIKKISEEIYAFPKNNKNFIDFIWNNPISINSTCFHRLITNDIKFPPNNYWEDRHFFIAVALRFSIVLVPELTTIVQHHTNQSINLLTNTNIIKATKDLIQCISSIFELNNIDIYISNKKKNQLIIREIGYRINLYAYHYRFFLSIRLLFLLIVNINYNYLKIFLKQIMVSSFQIIKNILKKIYETTRVNNNACI